MTDKIRWGTVAWPMDVTHFQCMFSICFLLPPSPPLLCPSPSILTFCLQCTKRRKRRPFTLALRLMMIVDQRWCQTKQSHVSERGTKQCYLHIKHLIFLNRQNYDNFTEPYCLLAKWVARLEMPFANFMMVPNVLLKLLDDEEINAMYISESSVSCSPITYVVFGVQKTHGTNATPSAPWLTGYQGGRG